MLPKEGMQKIADEMKVHVSSVSRTLNGKNPSKEEEVVDIALRIIEEAQQRKKELEDRIKKLSV